jgi:hypothetical protein
VRRTLPLGNSSKKKVQTLPSRREFLVSSSRESSDGISGQSNQRRNIEDRQIMILEQISCT